MFTGALSVAGQPLLQTPVLRGTHSVTESSSTTFKCHVAAGKGQLVAITWWKQVGEENTQVSGEDNCYK